MRNEHDITLEFEKKLQEYTGAPYAITLDCCSHAIFLALKWRIKQGDVKEEDTVAIPSHTYPSVPCEIIHNNLKLSFLSSSELLTGEYQLGDTNVWDSALRFTKGMYRGAGAIQCVSFNKRKHLKTKGGAILTDSYDLMQWAKKMRFSGRNEVDYLVDTITEVGYRYYMQPEYALRGLELLSVMMEESPVNKDKTIKYLNLTAQPAYKNYTI